MVMRFNGGEGKCRAVASSIIEGGGLIFMYSCSQTIKTIDFKRN